ncbi:uncharacterized protein IUM83_04721 [Phytophthora cinnamomi]|uniref:uncharacterized protein n=1 Tax=Phytophthora cinnamomi TaxID=4785 RepID=UPI00355A4CCD|nr:hypothetical protein IUM83_04721 [Phytophthora cinnamomi]
MSLPDAAEARRISAQLETLEQQRAQGRLPHEDTPLRLYRVGGGGFVRVLDEHPEPISQSMLEAIDAFIRRRDGDDESVEMKAPAEEQTEEEKHQTQGIEHDAAPLRAGDEEQSKSKQQQEEVEEEEEEAASGSDDALVAAPSAAAGVEDDDVEETQPSSTSAGVAMAPPWEAGTVAKTPQKLLAKNEKASDWLSASSTQNAVENQTTPFQEEKGGDHSVAVGEVGQEVEKPVDHPSLYEQWPPQLEERRKMWFVPRNSDRRLPAAGMGVKRPVVYWMHSTLRVMQGNFGLEAAILLSRRLAAPLVVVCLVPSSVLYPVCHSTTASDAYARFSFVELYQQFAQAGVPFFGITAKEDGTSATNEQLSLAMKPNPLYQLLDALAPHAVVTDAMFDSPSRSDMRINGAIASSPPPTTPQERKAMAMRKVMRSRAVNHLGKERDYALYLALWSAVNGEPSEPNGLTQPDIALLSTSDILSSLTMSAPRTSSLETYQNVLPSWAYSSARLGESRNTQVPGAALYDPYELESARTKDLYWNEIQKFLVEQQYLHPLLMVYWAYRVLTWSVSSRAAIATIESLMSQCALGSNNSPDAVFIVWKQLFRLGANDNSSTDATRGSAPNLEGLREFQLLLERELASQPKLQLHP